MMINQIVRIGEDRVLPKLFSKPDGFRIDFVGKF